MLLFVSFSVLYWHIATRIRHFSDAITLFINYILAPGFDVRIKCSDLAIFFLSSSFFLKRTDTFIDTWLNFSFIFRYEFGFINFELSWSVRKYMAILKMHTYKWATETNEDVECVVAIWHITHKSLIYIYNPVFRCNKSEMYTIFRWKFIYKQHSFADSFRFCCFFSHTLARSIHTQKSCKWCVAPKQCKRATKWI